MCSRFISFFLPISWAFGKTFCFLSVFWLDFPFSPYQPSQPHSSLILHHENIGFWYVRVIEHVLWFRWMNDIVDECLIRHFYKAFRFCIDVTIRLLCNYICLQYFREYGFSEDLKPYSYNKPKDFTRIIIKLYTQNLVLKGDFHTYPRKNLVSLDQKNNIRKAGIRTS